MWDVGKGAVLLAGRREAPDGCGLRPDLLPAAAGPYPGVGVPGVMAVVEWVGCDVHLRPIAHGGDVAVEPDLDRVARADLVEAESLEVKVAGANCADEIVACQCLPVRGDQGEVRGQKCLEPIGVARDERTVLGFAQLAQLLNVGLRRITVGAAPPLTACPDGDGNQSGEDEHRACESREEHSEVPHGTQHCVVLPPSAFARSPTPPCGWRIVTNDQGLRSGVLR